MTHKQGDAVIIVNKGQKGIATGPFPYREGAKKEKDNLQKVFVERIKLKYLYQDVLNSDLSLEEWNCGPRKDQQGNRINCKKCIICLIESAEGDPQSKYFVLAITSHGFTSDGKQFIAMRIKKTYLALKDVIATLRASQNLAGKTVMIIIDGCRAVRNGTG
ncbi:hypothetical protein DPMN_126900 [Dreissena polymorpha]|uniref:Caspase family p20 domain-containing protein n=1 Tax=Dreissena polymorpha TaxID=45954 RepID=A0A9D4GXZ0_DREPO|nr:hypothetical protein DPMN_126900 [Dreissena polymorpha]